MCDLIQNSKIFLLLFDWILIKILFFFFYSFQRWQRRWFVLFDDGELTYAVDDHVSLATKN
jgi:hypothetical protein